MKCSLWVFLFFYFGVDLYLIGVLTVILVLLVAFIAYIFLPQLKTPVTGVEGMIGLSGISLETLEPVGRVKIKGELWNAESINGTINKGERIVVEEVNNLKLIVKKLNPDK